MFDKLLPAIEDKIKDESGSMPVVFEGFDHVLEKKVSDSDTTSHKTHELFYLRSGKVEFTIEDRKVVLEKGNVLVIRPNALHDRVILSDTADSVILYFGFSRDAVSQSAAQPSLESFLEFADGDEKEVFENSPYIIITGEYRKSIGSIMKRIVEERKAEENLSKDLMLGILTVELMITLSRALKKEWEDSLRVKNGKTRELIVLARDYMDANYDHGITVANAAAYVFLSQGYFTRAFRDEFGVSPMTYLMKRRIGKACELLENNEIKVSAIASQAGFSSPQRFNVAFRKQTGMTPLGYRKSLQKKRESRRK